MNLTFIRRAYAERVTATAHLHTPGLLEAFAAVPREHYLGPGPWAILDPRALPERSDYVMTLSADPAGIYEDVCIALDRGRGLNNGQPSFLAFCIDALALSPGDRVLHIGCGVGYYSAIMAQVVGDAGRVTAVEIDPALAARAQENLAEAANVRALHADGSALPVDRYDAILVNAGVTSLQPAWLESLTPGGRILLPLTVSMVTVPRLTLGSGKLLRVVRQPEGFRHDSYPRSASITAWARVMVTLKRRWRRVWPGKTMIA